MPAGVATTTRREDILKSEKKTKGRRTLCREKKIESDEKKFPQTITDRFTWLLSFFPPSSSNSFTRSKDSLMAQAQARALATGVGARTTAGAQRTAVAPVASSSSTRRRKLQSPRTRSSPVSAPASAAAASADSSPSSSASASAAPASSQSASRRSRAGRATYAPATFDELVDDASTALLAALDDGLKRIEVEFPALPGDKDGACSSRSEMFFSSSED